MDHIFHNVLIVSKYTAAKFLSLIKKEVFGKRIRETLAANPNFVVLVNCDFLYRTQKLLIKLSDGQL